jgi:ATP-dependent Lon protease
VRTVAEKYGISPSFYKDKDIHIHFPEGAVPKDGHSAGVTMTVALISALTGRPARRDVAMTGEVSLHGNVLPIGGLKEKTLAAYNAGVSTVLIPRENERDLDDCDKDARRALRFVLCDTVEDNIRETLLSPESDAPITAFSRTSRGESATISAEKFRG